MKVLTYLFTLVISFSGLTQSSVLSKGSWFKVGIPSTGIYKLTKADLDDLGVNSNNLDSRNIKIFGNGIQGILPQANDATRPDDLLENAIFVEGEQDGSFDENDFILFYALGPDQKSWSGDGFSYEKNIYSDSAYYFLHVSDEPGKRISNHQNASGSGIPVTNFDDVEVFEEDVNNILSSGRGWYGELFDNEEINSFSFDLAGISSDIALTVKGVGQSPEPNYFRISTAETSIGDLTIATSPNGPGTTYSIKAQEATNTFNVSKALNLDLNFQFQANTSSGRGYLDYFYLTFKRTLQLRGSQTAFRTMDNLGALLEFQIPQADIEVWNVTNPTGVFRQVLAVDGAGSTFKSQSPEVEEFVVFSGSDLPSPILLGQISNQNLRGDTSYEGVIISSPLFLAEAERLATFHRTHDNLSIKVVTPEQIYNEFSSGRQDVAAIRDFAKHVYTEGAKLKYLLLFGDCSFDYKNRKQDNTNFVPTYESRNSFHPIFSHSSDDFFGFFEEEEGEWIEARSGDHTMEIGIGRLPAKSSEEAGAMVDKVIYYSTSPNTLGKWRNQIAYLADDGDSNIHASHVEDLSELIDTTYTQYQIDKLLLDAFDQGESAVVGKEESPETTRALKTRIKEGTFSINFIGHGNEELWMDEEILTEEVIESFTNRNKMPIFITATCEFGRYDDPSQVSGGEMLLLNENGGAIALLTTSRPVFASTNFTLNEAFHRNIFKKVNGEYQRLGDIIRVTKNEGLQGPVNRNFTLLGDPMMMPAFPAADIFLNELSSRVDTLSALEEITFTGEIRNEGTKDVDFNGTLDIAVFDIEQNFRTKGQESSPYNYTVRSNALFRGASTVSGGEFSFTFVVPKTISYQFNPGKMSLYAADLKRNIDASGSSKDFVIGGTSPSPTSDDEPPLVSMFLNDESFINGANVARSSMLFAKISDDNGITTTGNGLVQGITLTLNEEEINLNQFYSSDLDTYKSGVVAFPIQDLDPGNYTAILAVYDTHNNLTKKEISFNVIDGSFISLFNQKVFPNPAQEQTNFTFEHDREEQDLDISIVVYNSQGEVVNKSTYLFENSSRLVEIPWATRTNSGQLLNRGVYFYRLIVKSNFDGAIKEIANKLVIVN